MSTRFPSKTPIFKNYVLDFDKIWEILSLFTANKRMDC